MKEALKKLSEIQTELKVPKNQKNLFGKYNYRSAEDILEALKPVAAQKNVTIIVTEELRNIEGHIFVESTAALYDIDSGEVVEVKASAIVDLHAKGMHKPQQTGSASSYAKKYALGNLLLLDDTKDADSQEPVKEPVPRKKPPVTQKIDPVAKNEPQSGAKKKPVSKTHPKPKPTPTKGARRKALSVTQRDNFLKGIEEGKFLLVEKHLKNYAVDAKSKAVTTALNKAKKGE